tara:strand:+ start:117 stop:248 length:132 start_codon:yes stop_codon:yes gene_type:complete
MSDFISGFFSWGKTEKDKEPIKPKEEIIFINKDLQKLKREEEE